MSKRITLSIRLLKEGVPPEDAFKEQPESELGKYDQIAEAKYYIDKGWSFPPDWVKYLGWEKPKVSTASALLFIPISDSGGNHRHFVVSFGYGYAKLNDDRLVSDFGLITALNMLDNDGIKSSSVFAPSDHSKQKKTQTTRASSLVGHDMDYYTQILKNVTGRVKDKYEVLSKNITASLQSIKISTGEEVKNLPELCRKFLEIYQKEDYKENFKDLFYIERIKEKDLCEKLNKKLIKGIQDKSDNIYLEVPELIDFQSVSKWQIKFKGNRSKKEFDDVPTIKEFHGAISEYSHIGEIKVESLKKWEINLLDENDTSQHSFSIFKCLVFETNLDEETYCFSHGYWYHINSDFKEEVISKTEEYKIEKINGKSIPIFAHQNEAAYNEDLAKSTNGKLLDKNCISMGGYDKIELCDVLYISNNGKTTFLHVKIKHGGSSGLSHLFAQGDNSLTLLRSKDSKFIEGIKVVTNLGLEDIDKDVKVHFLIISKNGRDIPFFAKVSLFKTIKEIISKNSKVQWSVQLNTMPQSPARRK